MRQLIFIIILLTGYFSIAQSQVVNILDDDGLATTDTYYKDVNNLLNPFEGTYIYENGATSFKIVLVKKVQQFNGRYYEDLIIGEYQYFENGIEKVNTLNELSIVYNNQRIHNINGNTLINNNNRVWTCPSCNPGEKRLRTTIRDASTNRFAKLIMRRTTEGGQQVMKINIKHVSRTFQSEGEPTPSDFALPLGEYILIKQ
jgi:hypothetical protein